MFMRAISLSSAILTLSKAGLGINSIEEIGSSPIPKGGGSG